MANRWTGSGANRWANTASKRRSWRPGGGEFSPPPDKLFASKDYLRSRFMEIVWSGFPELQRSLHTLYDNELGEVLARLPAGGFFAVASRQAGPAIKKWAEPWHLTDPWCVNRLLNRVCLWLANGSAGEVREIGIDRPFYTPFSFLRWLLGSWDPKDWDPTERIGPAFKAEIYKSLEPVLDAYCEAVRFQARMDGYVTNPELRRPEDHLCWLAAHQVGRWSMEGIADALESSHFTVQSAVNNLAKLIDLNLRDPSDHLKSDQGQIRLLLKSIALTK
jgi:hypothetical protein